MATTATLVTALALAGAVARAMNKAELIDAMASGADISKADAKKALDSFVDTTSSALKKGDRVALVGFGTFSASKAAPTGGADGDGDAGSDGRGRRLSTFDESFSYDFSYVGSDGAPYFGHGAEPLQAVDGGSVLGFWRVGDADLCELLGASDEQAACERGSPPRGTTHVQIAVPAPTLRDGSVAVRAHRLVRQLRRAARALGIDVRRRQRGESDEVLFDIILPSLDDVEGATDRDMIIVTADVSTAALIDAFLSVDAERRLAADAASELGLLPSLLARTYPKIDADCGERALAEQLGLRGVALCPAADRKDGSIREKAAKQAAVATAKASTATRVATTDAAAATKTPTDSKTTKDSPCANAPGDDKEGTRRLAAAMAAAAGISFEQSLSALKVITTNMPTELKKKGDSVQLAGFGSFSISKRAARTGRNPQTGKEIKIAAKNVVKFKAGADLSGKVN